MGQKSIKRAVEKYGGNIKQQYDKETSFSIRLFYFEKVHCDMNTPFWPCRSLRGAFLSKNPVFSRLASALTN